MLERPNLSRSNWCWRKFQAISEKLNLCIGNKYDYVSGLDRIRIKRFGRR